MVDVSIIIPLYNVEKYIENTINSILNQNFSGSYQVLLIDDGSTDNTFQICNSFVNKCENIIYKKIDNNGVGNARNMGLSLANSKYVCFIDSDDTISDNYLQKLYDSIQDDCDLVVAGYKRINEFNNREVLKCISAKNYIKDDFCYLIPVLQNNNMFNQVWNKIFKLDIIKENNLLFPTNITYGEDFRFVVEYLEYTNRINVIDDIIYYYVNRTNGLNLKYRKDRIYINLNNVFILEDFFVKNNYNKSSYDDYIDSKIFKTLISGICSIYENPNKKSIRNDLKDFLNCNEVITKLNSYKNFKVNFILVFSKNGWILFDIFICLMIFFKKLYKKIKLGY